MTAIIIQCRMTVDCPKLPPALGFFMALRDSTLTANAEALLERIHMQKIFRKPVLGRKNIIIGVVVLLVLIGFFIFRPGKQSAGSPTTKTVKVSRTFSFPAIASTGRLSDKKISFKMATAEKTDQVIVKDQTFIAKNKKMFLIINVELKNDSTQPLNIAPGDLIRLTYNGDDKNKYAADLHNNLVPVAPISTKLDRIGFVIPKDVKDITLYVGELEGNKEAVAVHFPS